MISAFYDYCRILAEQKERTMKTICYKLSFPKNNSWNGKWSGEGKLYAKCRTYKNETADKILSKKSYYYNFGDGWVASVSVSEITPKEKKVINKKSLGFYGYGWMIDSIETYGIIKAK